jgi:hypothetical protein
MTKPVTDEQVFYDKFSYDKCSLSFAPIARVYVEHSFYVRLQGFGFLTGVPGNLPPPTLPPPPGQIS